MKRVGFNNDRKFGIEFEVVNKYSASKYQVVQAIKRYNLLIRDTDSYFSNADSTERYWTVKRDGSIDGNGFEIVSPVLKGQDGIRQVKIVTKILDKHCTINRSCGLHVHWETRDFNGEDFIKLYNFSLRFQSTMDFLVPKSRRENCYCRSWAGSISENNSSLVRNLTDGSRYHTINFNSYSVRGTIEFRQHAGTTDFEKVLNWILFTQSVIETVKEKSFVTSKRFDRETFRYGSMDKLLGFLNWIKIETDDVISDEIVVARTFLRKRYKSFKKEVVA